MKKYLLSAAAAFCALMTVPSIADAAVRGFSTANVNMRSGPSTSYPAVTVIPVGSPVTIHGCMSSVNWCDVAFSGGRGWVSGNYVQASYQQRRVYVGPQYYRPLGIPTVTFEVGNYWDRHYRGRDFYRDRDRWDRGPDRGGWDRDRDRDRGDWNRDRDRDRDRERADRDRDRDRADRDRVDRDRADRDRAERDRAAQDRIDRDRDRNRDRADRDKGRDRERGSGSGVTMRPDGTLCSADGTRCTRGN